MSDFGFPILYALGLWWLSTGVVLYLDNLPRATFRRTLLGGVTVLSVAVFGLVISSAFVTHLAAYMAFTSGVVVWGVIEMSYFTGLVTGPRKSACPPRCSHWRRFGLAILTSLYHELAIVGMVGFLLIITWGEPNQVGTWTFIVLWLMRWSAKLNIFLGVLNLNEEWLPEQLRYLKSYMSNRGMNLLFPVSVTLATVVAVLMVLEAMASPAGSFARVGLVLVSALLALAILEHWFLVLPLPDEALWGWALPKRDPNGTDSGDATRSPSSPSDAEHKAGPKVAISSVDLDRTTRPQSPPAAVDPDRSAHSAGAPHEARAGHSVSQQRMQSSRVRWVSGL